MKSTSPTFSITFNNPPVQPTFTTTLKEHPPAPKKQPTPTLSITLNNPPVRPLQPSVTVTLKKQTLPLFSRTALNTWFLSLWSAPPDPRHLANMEITTIHGADLSMWGLPAGILLRDRIKKLRGLFLQELYTATTSDAASAAAINFRKEIDLWILDMQNYTMKCPGYNRSQRKLNLLLVKRRTRNLTYKDALQKFSDNPNLETLPELRGALKQLYYIKNLSANWIFWCHIFILPIKFE